LAQASILKMATQNVRVVGYLPPDYHQKLRQYMEAEFVTESAAIVKIIKQFFDSPEVVEATPEKGDEIAELKANVAQLMQRLTILEQAVISGQRVNSTKSRTSYQYGAPPVLPPQTSAGLARRMGVSASTVDEAYQQGEDYFKNWSRRMDPTKRSWQKRGELFHPLSE